MFVVASVRAMIHATRDSLTSSLLHQRLTLGLRESSQLLVTRPTVMPVTSRDIRRAVLAATDRERNGELEVMGTMCTLRMVFRRW